jgi:hypothetical protein
MYSVQVHCLVGKLCPGSLDDESFKIATCGLCGASAFCICTGNQHWINRKWACDVPECDTTGLEECLHLKRRRELAFNEHPLWARPLRCFVSPDHYHTSVKQLLHKWGDWGSGKLRDVLEVRLGTSDLRFDPGIVDCTNLFSLHWVTNI